MFRVAACSDRIEMNVTGHGQKVVVCVDQEGLVPALVEMPHPVVPPIESRSVADVEMSHEIGKVPIGSVDQ